jgi:hypothetical protein
LGGVRICYRPGKLKCKGEIRSHLINRSSVSKLAPRQRILARPARQQRVRRERDDRAPGASRREAGSQSDQNGRPFNILILRESSKDRCQTNRNENLCIIPWKCDRAILLHVTGAGKSELY